MTAQRRRVRIPRAIQPGTPRASREGAKLTCLLLSNHGREWLGLDLASGAFVRVENTSQPRLSSPGMYSVVTVSISRTDDPADPTRPELVIANGEAEALGEVTGRRVRRLFGLVEILDQPGATLVSSRGPSIAYVDLDGSAPSLALIPAKHAQFELMAIGEGAMLAISFGGVRQRLPIVEERLIQTAHRVAPRSLDGANLARELGFAPSHALVGLSDVREGHVRKAVFALLARAKK